METAALVLGIISLIISLGGAPLGCGWIGSICGILAIIFGASGLSSTGDKRSSAKAGFVLGIISVFGGIILTLLFVVLLGGALFAAFMAG